MKVSQRIIACGLLAAQSLALIGCSPQQHTYHPPEPTYVSGTVKGEALDWGYSFSVQTERGLKVFSVFSSKDESLDALINPGDKVKVKLSPYTNIQYDNISISLEDVVEVNGYKINLKE